MAVNADKLVQIVPRVIAAGTSGLTFAGLFVSESHWIPAGRVMRFSSAQAVGEIFGFGSLQYRAAVAYFNGYVNTQYLPNQIYFAAYRPQGASAWVRGGSFEGTLEELKTITDGHLVVNIDGFTHAAHGVSFYTATSFSDCARILQEALSAPVVHPATSGKLTGAKVLELEKIKTVAGELTVYVDGSEVVCNTLQLTEVKTLAEVAKALDTALESHATVSTKGGCLIITSDSAGANSSISVKGDKELAILLGLTPEAGAVSIQGTDEEQSKPPIVGFGSGLNSFQITSRVTGAESSISFPQTTGRDQDLAKILCLTEEDGAIISEGMDPQTLTECMNNVLKYARDWVSFSTLIEPTYDEKLELAKWCASWDTRFVYCLWDTDISARQMGSTASAGYAICKKLALDGTACIYDSLELAAAVMGAIACLNFNQYNGRTTLAFREFDGVTVTCDDDEDYDNLIENGYNCYSDFTTASANFRFFQNGQVSGRFEWLDTYCNAIAIKDALQLNILDLFKAARSLPYNEEGYSQIRTACLDTVNRFLNFGAIRPGVVLSQTQKVQLLQEIGQDVSQTLESVGWYMKISDPGAVARGRRETPNCAFYYMDGGSIQKIEMSSTVIQ